MFSHKVKLNYGMNYLAQKFYRDKISVYVKRHPRAGSNTQLTSAQELVRIQNMCGYKIAIK